MLTTWEPQSELGAEGAPKMNHKNCPVNAKAWLAVRVLASSPGFLCEFRKVS